MKKSSVILAAVCAASLGLSLVVWCFRLPGTRYVFMFESASNSKICMESRYLPRNPVQGKVNMYVDELLLGPLTAEYMPLFSRGTKAESCFMRGDVLYVNLSDALLAEDGNASEIKQGIELFRKNILYNFRNIHTVDVFVAGEYAYEEVELVKQ
ncbi:MAG: GerMN domain-containing protein [Treponema sp.]|nr:GerMN domain-containing protein [Treponema sp.]